MESSKFRQLMMETVRDFDKYAWTESMENPEDYQNLSFKDWLDLFYNYAESKND